MDIQLNEAENENGLARCCEGERRRVSSTSHSDNVSTAMSTPNVATQDCLVNGETLGLPCHTVKFHHTRSISAGCQVCDVSARLTEPSTLCLIMNDRPNNIMPKPEEEIRRHLQLNEDLIKSVKKEQELNIKHRMTSLYEKLRKEDQIHQLNDVWRNDVIPRWSILRNSSRVSELWWLGLPSSVRSDVWKLALPNDLRITNEFINILLSVADKNIILHDSGNLSELHAHGITGDKTDVGTTECVPISDPEDVIWHVDIDLDRTFPHISILKKGGPFYDQFRRLLVAYCSFRKDIGYVQGMAFVMGMFLLNMDSHDTFLVFANIMNRPLQLALYSLREDALEVLYEEFSLLLCQTLPHLHSQFESADLQPSVYLIDWLFTMYTRVLPLEVATRVIDLFFLYKEEFMFRTALGILKLHQTRLLKMDCFSMSKLLTSNNLVTSEQELFDSISSIPRPTKWCNNLIKRQSTLLGFAYD